MNFNLQLIIKDDELEDWVMEALRRIVDEGRSFAEVNVATLTNLPKSIDLNK